MRTVFLCGVAALALAGCASNMPDSGAGVGFQDYGEQQYRSQQEALNTQLTVQPPTAVETSTLDGNSLETQAAASAAAQNSGVAPLQASPANAAPQMVTNSAGISNENSFEAVSAERDIQDDAALIAQNRAQYQVVTPTQLPPRPDSNSPNIVAYALQTTNPVGTPLYERSGRYDGNRIGRACGQYNSSHLAQEAFLAAGGPQRDRKGLDPDGDGFACAWDPAPFRAARGG
jgi:hypothetical protein